MLQPLRHDVDQLAMKLYKNENENENEWNGVKVK